MNEEQNDWAGWLPTAEYAYNSSVHESTQMTPFEANFGYTPEMSRPAREGANSERALIIERRIVSLVERLQKNLTFV